MWHEGSVSKKIILVLILLVLMTGAFALRAAWERTPQPKRKVKAQAKLFKYGYRNRDRFNDRGNSSKPVPL